LPPFFDHKYRIVYSISETVARVEEIKHPVVKALLQYFKVEKGVEIHHDGDLPARSGLGSSSAFTVGMLGTLYALQGKMISKHDLATTAIGVERDILKENVGSQDQVAVSYGGFNKIHFCRDHSFRVEPVTLGTKRIEELKKHLMLIYTGQSRIASQIAEEQIRNTRLKKNELQEMGKMVDQAIAIMNGTGALDDFGKLLSEAWRLKKSLSQKISNSMIDDIYQKAISQGAVGGKILGAGGGGFMLLFIPPEKRPAIKRVLAGLLEVKFAFENEGSHIIYYNPQNEAEAEGANNVQA